MFQGVYAFAPALHTQVLWKMKVIKTFIITALLFFPKIQLTVHKRFKLSAAVFLYTCTLRLLDYKKRLLELFPPAARALSLASLRSHDLASASLLWGEKLAGNEKCSSRHYRSPVLYGQEKRNSWVQSAKKDKRKTIVNNPRARCVNKMVNHNYDVTN